MVRRCRGHGALRPPDRAAAAEAAARARDARRRHAEGHAVPVGHRDRSPTSRTRNETLLLAVGLLDPINAVVLFKTDGEKTSFVLLQRAGQPLVELPSEPVLSPDRQRLAIADFCATRCTNELTDLARRRARASRASSTWRSTADWADVTPRWKDAETLVVEYVRRGRRHAAHARAQARARAAGSSRASGMADADTRDVVRRPVRSFVLRQGRMSPAQARALDELSPRYGIDVRARAARLRAGVRAARAGRARDRLRHGRDDGGDRGGAARARFPRRRGARAGGRRDPATASTLGGLTNVRVIQHDAVEVVDAMIRRGVARRRARLLSRSLAEEAPSQAAAPEARVRARARAAAGAGRLPARGDRLGAVRRGDPRRPSRASRCWRTRRSGFAPRPAWRPQTKFETRGLKLGPRGLRHRLPDAAGDSTRAGSSPATRTR